jgi:hypothetical protein
MDDQENRHEEAPLAHRVPHDASAAQIAEATAAAWQQIDAMLSPIVGRRGVAALYRRSLQLAGSAHPWLVHEGTPEEIDLAALQSVIAQQGSAQAANGGNALLQTFYRLLASLIGPSLTERLLRSVWDSSSGPPAQDTTP